jgi:hypothetical protein
VPALVAAAERGEFGARLVERDPAFRRAIGGANVPPASICAGVSPPVSNTRGANTWTCPKGTLSLGGMTPTTSPIDENARTSARSSS